MLQKNATPSKAQQRKNAILDYTRKQARERAKRGKINAVIELDTQDRVRCCLLHPTIAKPQ